LLSFSAMLMRTCQLAGATAIILGIYGETAAADSAEDFYRNKRMTVLIGYGPGAENDTYGRLLSRHIGRLIPGNPVVIAQNRVGAGSILLANEMYLSAPSDGSVIALIGNVLPMKQMLQEPSIKFHAEEFKWLGRLTKTLPVLALRNRAATLEEAQRMETAIGVPGAGSATAQTISAMNNLLGTKFKLISGYQSGGEIRLAMDRGEVDGVGSIFWERDAKDWVRANKYKIFYQISDDKAVDLPDVPRLTDLGQTDEQRRLLQFFSSYTEIGVSFLAPPNVPSERVSALRAAFDKLAADPKYLADAQQLGLELSFASGEHVQKLVSDTTNLTGALLDQAIEASKVKVFEK
jgi:tripartite-type tricarboxylate transporter receptor subunit TctC